MTNRLKPFFLALIFLFGILPCVFAAQVKRIDFQTSILTLDNDQQVYLLGVDLSEESKKSLAMLLSKQNIEIEQDKNYQSLLPGATGVYVWIQQSDLDFPLRDKASPRKSRVLLNKLLISFGFATADQTSNYKFKEDFIRAQEEAKTQGKGIWSFESTVKHKYE